MRPHHVVVRVNRTLTVGRRCGLAGAVALISGLGACSSTLDRGVNEGGPTPSSIASDAEGGSGAPVATNAAPSGVREVGAECLPPARQRSAVGFDGPNGSRLAGVALGRGKAGVVLAHQSPGSLCQWWPYAAELADAGYRVLAFDFDGMGASTDGKSDYAGDVVAAAGWLRAHGVQKVVLMGGSAGGTAVVVAASRLKPAPVGVVDLSGPADFAGMDAEKAARTVRMPILFGVGEDDGAFPDYVRQVRAAAASTSKPLVTVSDNAHGAALVDPNVGYPKIRVAVKKFLTQVTTER